MGFNMLSRRIMKQCRACLSHTVILISIRTVCFFTESRSMSAPIVDIEDLFRNPHYKANPRLTKTSVLRPTKQTKELFTQYRRNIKKNTLSHELLNDFSLAIHSDLTEEEAVQEAARCLKCADAPVSRRDSSTVMPLKC